MFNSKSVLPVVALFTVFAAFGCKNPQDKLNAATTAENSGNYREAASLYAALVIETAPAHKLPDAQKGKIMQPALWQSELEKYVTWLTEPSAPLSGTLKTALDGLDRCTTRFDADNTAQPPQTKPLDSLPAFTTQWNTAFNPPPPNTIDWAAVVKTAFNKKFSILQLSAPVSYAYEISIVSRKTSRRITLTLPPSTPDTKSKMLAPLPEGEYTMIVQSTVDFQKGQHWSSDYTAFPIAVGGTPSLITMDFKTKIARKQN